MFSFQELERVQIEITNRCQASCPMCLRNIHGGIENPSLMPADWSLEDFVSIFNKEVLSQIKQITFCGDFGDPIINNSLIEMCRYVKENSNVFVSINTNGGARNKEWWKQLATALPRAHNVVFALDGLEDTHNLYRIGTDYSNILKNAKAFIDEGGTAEWMMIRFKHNQHQVKQAEQIAKDIGFKKFTVKNSKRFGKKFPVLDRMGKVSYHIEQSTDSNIRPVEFIDLEEYKKWQNADKMNCFTVKEKELYIDAFKTAMPCCLMASFLYANYDSQLYSKYDLLDETSVVPIANQIKDNVLGIVEELGGIKNLDTAVYGIKEIMNSYVWQTLVKSKWGEKESSACIILCSEDSPFISIKDQYINRA
jgi:MoaA/NifB/PqqE/SkfB family radical SAM enzyme